MITRNRIKFILFKGISSICNLKVKLRFFLPIPLLITKEALQELDCHFNALDSKLMLS